MQGEGDSPGEPGPEAPPGDDPGDDDGTPQDSEDPDLAGQPGGSDIAVDQGISNGAGGTGSAPEGSAPEGSVGEAPPGSAGTTGVVEGEPPPVVVPAEVDRFFGDWPAGADPLTVGTRAAEIFTSQQLGTGSGHDNEDDYKHYKDACAWYGALEVAELGGQTSLINALVSKYQPYVGTWGAFDPPTAQNTFVGFIDDSTFGIVPLEIAKFSGDSVYAQEGVLAADHQVTHLAAQLRQNSDDMFHVAALQMQAYRVSTDPAQRQRHLDAAADTMVSYLSSMQKNDGLIPHHLNQPGFDISWSRGNGWFASGLTELMREIPSTHPDYVRIASGYQRMMNGLLQYQIPAARSRPPAAPCSPTPSSPACDGVCSMSAPSVPPLVPPGWV
jgi:glycosyl hydrolase family 88